MILYEEYLITEVLPVYLKTEMAVLEECIFNYFSEDEEITEEEAQIFLEMIDETLESTKIQIKESCKKSSIDHSRCQDVLKIAEAGAEQTKRFISEAGFLSKAFGAGPVVKGTDKYAARMAKMAKVSKVSKVSKTAAKPGFLSKTFGAGPVVKGTDKYAARMAKMAKSSGAAKAGKTAARQGFLTKAGQFAGRHKVGLAVAGTVAAGLLYRKYLSKAARACKTAPDKNACMEKYREKAKKLAGK